MIRISRKLRTAMPSVGIPLRTLVVFGGGGMVAVAVSLLITLQVLGRTTAVDQLAVKTHYGELRDLIRAHQQVVLEQELWVLRGRNQIPLDPVRADTLRAQADRTRATMLAELSAPEVRPLASTVAAVERAARAWQEVLDREASHGPPPLESTLAERGAALRDAETSLIAGLQARSQRRGDDLQQRVERLQLARRLTMLITCLLGLLFLRYITIHIARPLGQLTAIAGAGGQFPEDDPNYRVREVRHLARALHALHGELDQRQARLRQAHTRAVSLNRFAELLQNTGQPDAIHLALVTMIEDTLIGGEVRVVELQGPDGDPVRTWPGAPTNVEIDASTCPALRRRRPYRGDAGTPSACNCPFGAPDEGAYACMPMMAAKKVTGLINIRSRKPKAWGREIIMTAQSYVDLASSALNANRVLETTQDQASRDGLTGAYNRWFLNEYLTKRLADCVRHGHDLAVLLLDLDHFKKLNDTYGHATGDRALVEFARLVQSQIRTGDALVRYGGEEFVLLLSSTDAEGALTVAERIRAKTEQINLDLSTIGLPPSLSVSIGVAAAVRDGCTAAEVLAAADQALYQAKAAGRNRVVDAKGVVVPALALAPPVALVAGS